MEKSLTFKLRFFIFFIGASTAAFGPFLPVYYSSRSLTFTEMGVLFALSAIMGVVLQPVWGYISDKYLNKKKTLIICLIFSILVVIFFTRAHSFWTIMLLVILNNIFMCSINPIIDAYIFDVIEEKDKLNYSNFRFISSASWGLANLVLGYVIKAYGIDCSFVIYVVLTVTALLMLFFMKYEGRKNEQNIDFHDVRLIFKDYRMALFFLSVFLVNAAFLGGVNYMNELVKFTHGDVSKLGLVWFITCTFEVATFVIAVKVIDKLGRINVYLISAVLYGVKFVLDYLFKNADYIIAAQILEGMAFALFLSSGINYLNDNTAAKVRSTAMSLFAAIGGLGAFASSLLGGILLNLINPSQLYGLFALLCFIAFLFALPLVPEKPTGIGDGLVDGSVEIGNKMVP